MIGSKGWYVLLALILGLATSGATIASGERDPSFGENGLVVIQYDHADPAGNDAVAGGIVDKQSRYLTFGYTYAYGDEARYGFIARNLPDGSADMTFAGDGRLNLPTGSIDVAITDIAQRNHWSGGYLVAANKVVTAPGGSYYADPMVCRINEDNGSLDYTFGAAGCRDLSAVANMPALKSVSQVLVLADGKILLKGLPFKNPDDPRGFAFVRLMPDGTDDMTFGVSNCPAPSPRCAFAPGPTSGGWAYTTRAVVSPTNGRMTVAQAEFASNDPATLISMTGLTGTTLTPVPIDFEPITGEKLEHQMAAILMLDSSSPVVVGEISNGISQDPGPAYLGLTKFGFNGEPDSAFGAFGYVAHDLGFDRLVDISASLIDQKNIVVAAKALMDFGDTPDKCVIVRIGLDSGALLAAFGDNGVVSIEDLDDCAPDSVVYNKNGIVLFGTTRFPIDSGVKTGGEKGGAPPYVKRAFLLRLDGPQLFRDGFE